MATWLKFGNMYVNMDQVRLIEGDVSVGDKGGAKLVFNSSAQLDTGDRTQFDHVDEVTVDTSPERILELLGVEAVFEGGEHCSRT